MLVYSWSDDMFVVDVSVPEGVFFLLGAVSPQFLVVPTFVQAFSHFSFALLLSFVFLSTMDNMYDLFAQHGDFTVNGTNPYAGVQGNSAFHGAAALQALLSPNHHGNDGGGS